MSAQRTTLSWCDTSGQWWLRVGDATLPGPGRLIAVPAAVRQALQESGGLAAASDPADDLLVVEGRLRSRVQRLEQSTVWLRAAVRTARADLDAARGLRDMVRIRQRRRLTYRIGDAVDELTAGVEELDE